MYKLDHSHNGSARAIKSLSVVQLALATGYRGNGVPEERLIQLANLGFEVVAHTGSSVQLRAPFIALLPPEIDTRFYYLSCAVLVGLLALAPEQIPLYLGTMTRNEDLILKRRLVLGT